MLIETERLIITEFTMDMAQVVQENSVDEDNKKFVPDEVWESVEEVEETLEFQHRNSKEYLRGFTELIRVDQRPPEERGWVWQL